MDSSKPIIAPSDGLYELMNHEVAANPDGNPVTFRRLCIAETGPQVGEFCDIPIPQWVITDCDCRMQFAGIIPFRQTTKVRVGECILNGRLIYERTDINRS